MEIPSYHCRAYRGRSLRGSKPLSDDAYADYDAAAGTQLSESVLTESERLLMKPHRLS